MNDMRKLMETAAQLDESVYIANPEARKRLSEVLNELQKVVIEFDLDIDDVATLVERKLYKTGDFKYSDHDV